MSQEDIRKKLGMTPKNVRIIKPGQGPQLPPEAQRLAQTVEATMPLQDAAKVIEKWECLKPESHLGDKNCDCRRIAAASMLIGAAQLMSSAAQFKEELKASDQRLEDEQTKHKKDMGRRLTHLLKAEAIIAEARKFATAESFPELAKLIREYDVTTGALQ